jgi:LacI family transcriptional regulator
VIDACGRLGLAVPEQVAVLGVDNDEVICNLCTPTLSSVVPNPEMVGYRAAEVLDELMSGGGPRPEEAWPMLIEPLGVATRQSTDLEAVEDPEVALALKIIREGSCRGLTVPDLLDRVLISRSSLERRFRKEVGLSPQGMIRQTQVKRAQQLLVETDLSLDQIAPLVGFKHAEHFAVVFKRQVGQTPGAYRRRFRG